MNQPSSRNGHRIVGRYAIFDEIAQGGMATIHLGRMLGEVGFTRTVAIKRLHPQYAKDPEFVAMFLDEARLAARVRHPNVVPTLDVVSRDDELFLVMEYVQGESLGKLIRQTRLGGNFVPPQIALSILIGALHGLHAAHEATNERGQPLGIVHRDISPQNILVGIDGVARVLDFGVAKAQWRVVSTREGEFKGKIPYSAPELLGPSHIQADRRVDIYAAAVCLWEALAGKRLFEADSPAVLLHQVLTQAVPPPSYYAPGLPPGVDEVVLCGLARDPRTRFPTARDMAMALENINVVSSQRQVGEWVDTTVTEALRDRARRVAEVEAISNATGASRIVARAALRRSGQTDEGPSRWLVALFAFALTVAALVGLVVGMRYVMSGSGKQAPINMGSPPAAQAPGTGTGTDDTAPNEGATGAATPPALDLAPPQAMTPDTATAATDLPTVSTPPRPPPTPPRGPGPTGPAVTAHPTAKKNCEPPYTVDSSGIRKPKLECL